MGTQRYLYSTFTWFSTLVSLGFVIGFWFICPSTALIYRQSTYLTYFYSNANSPLMASLIFLLFVFFLWAYNYNISSIIYFLCSILGLQFNISLQISIGPTIYYQPCRIFIVLVFMRWLWRVYDVISIHLTSRVQALPQVPPLDISKGGKWGNISG